MMDSSAVKDNQLITRRREPHQQTEAGHISAEAHSLACDPASQTVVADIRFHLGPCCPLMSQFVSLTNPIMGKQDVKCIAKPPEKDCTSATGTENFVKFRWLVPEIYKWTGKQTW